MKTRRQDNNLVGLLNNNFHWPIFSVANVIESSTLAMTSAFFVFVHSSWTWTTWWLRRPMVALPSSDLPETSFRTTKKPPAGASTKSASGKTPSRLNQAPVIWNYSWIQIWIQSNLCTTVTLWTQKVAVNRVFLKIALSLKKLRIRLAIVDRWPLFRGGR